MLWTLAFLSLLITAIAVTARGEARIADGLRNAAAARAVADGAVREAMFRLLDRSGAHWDADGVVRAIRIPPGVAEVRIVNEDGKIDLNAATQPLLSQLLVALGLDRGAAASLGAAIIDWRTVGLVAQPNGAKAPQYAAARLPYGPPNENYRSIDELALVRGMPPTLVQAILPHVTVYGSRNITLADADPVVAQAVTALGNNGLTALPGADAAGQQTLYATVTVLATVNGARTTRRAIVAVQPTDASAPYRILTWDDTPE